MPMARPLRLHQAPCRGILWVTFTQLQGAVGQATLLPLAAVKRIFMTTIQTEALPAWLPPWAGGNETREANLAHMLRIT
jgi:hypothetical protein